MPRIYGNLSEQAPFVQDAVPVLTNWGYQFLRAIRDAVATLTSGIVTDDVLFVMLPPTPRIGQIANVSDGSTITWGAVVAGGGAHHIAVRWNGSAWTCTGI